MLPTESRTRVPMKRSMKQLISGICILLILTCAVQAQAGDQDTIAAYLIEQQFTDPALTSYGAIKVHHTPGYVDTDSNLYFRVVPYFSHLAVIGLLESNAADKLLVAERWMTWYMNHLDMSGNPAGVVYDHWYLKDGTAETTGPAGIAPYYVNFDDSSDSYAALFLVVANTYYENGGSVAFLNTPGNKEKFEIIATVILALQDPSDGLTWAKANWPVKYLMNASEVYSGLLAMEALERNVFKDTILADFFAIVAAYAKKGIKGDLYNKSTSLYDTAKFGNGEYEAPDLNNWYPGTTPLVWPHLFNVENPKNKKSRTQMLALNNAFDGDPNPDWTSDIADPWGFLWPSIGYASLLTGDTARAETQMKFILNSKLPDFAFPFAINEAGWMLRTLVALENAGVTVESGLTPVESVLASGGEEEVVASLLQSVATADSGTSSSVDKIIEDITSSFDESLWIDATHLTDEGKKVFKEGKKAIKELLNLVDEGGDISAEAQSAIDFLISTYSTVAQVAINEAVEALQAIGCYEADASKECGKLVKDLDKAEIDMAKADEKLADGRPDKAVDLYKKAWDLAQIF